MLKIAIIYDLDAKCCSYRNTPLTRIKKNNKSWLNTNSIQTADRAIALFWQHNVKDTFPWEKKNASACSWYGRVYDICYNLELAYNCRTKWRRTCIDLNTQQHSSKKYQNWSFLHKPKLKFLDWVLRFTGAPGQLSTASFDRGTEGGVLQSP